MAFDGIVLNTLINELHELIDNKIDKIYQPNNNELVLNMRRNRTGSIFMISVDPQYSSLFLTNQKKENPLTPPMFCMILRKYIQGGRIKELKQIGLDRVVEILIESQDELGHTKNVKLICEFMGKHSNIILVDSDSQTILDSIKRIPPSLSRKRQILPGMNYCVPDREDKMILTDFFSEDDFASKFLDLDLDTPVRRGLVQIFEGFSPLLATEISFRSGIAIDSYINDCGQIEISKLYQQLLKLRDTLLKQNYSPTMAFKGKILKSFSCIDLSHMRSQYNVQHIDTSVNMLNHVYHFKKSHNTLSSYYNKLKQIVKSESDKHKKKLAIQNDVMAKSKDAEQYRIMGELITANIYQISPGKDKITVTNFYDPNQSDIEIELKPELSPSQNAQSYFKVYNKKKKATQMAVKLRKNITEQLKYVESLEHSLERAESTNDLNEIEEEMKEQNMISVGKEKHDKRKKKKETKLQYQPHHFISTSGLEIRVGKNNKQNDWLTLKASNKNDLWFHTQNIPGAHVVLRQNDKRTVDETSITEAAMLAVYYSKAKYSNQVPVDYTKIKHVSKRSGANPGMVNYTDQETLFISPTEDFLEKFELE